MCRLLLVLSNNKLKIKDIEKYLWFYDHALFKQSYKDPYTPDDEHNNRNHKLNLDGFGLGIYNKSNPKVYTNIIPSWNDKNLFNFIDISNTNILLAHIRATGTINTNTLNFIHREHISPVHIYNCHPFTYKKYMFCHNGLMEEFYNGLSRKKLINEIDNKYITKILGNTDTEYIFYLILTYIKQNNHIIESIKQTIKFINRLNPNSILSFNTVLTDGINTYVTRYINQKDLNPPSLYINKNNNRLLIASEPIKKKKTWDLIDSNKLIHIYNNEIKEESLYL